MLSLISFLALAVTAGAAPLSATPALAPVAIADRDSTPDPALTAEQLAHYLAVKQALGPFWQAHAALLQTARTTAHARTVQIGQQQFPVGVFDYPALVKQDTALAALFTKNHFDPGQFEPTQVAVVHALGVLALATAGASALPESTTVVGQNIALVKAHQQELAAVGVALQVNSSAGGPGNPGSGPLNFAATQAQDQAQTQQNNQFVASNQNPILSPRDTARATVGGAHLLVDYGRPSRRGRAIFGALVPYGQVWRTGANAATVLKTDKALKLDTLTVPPGEYTLYTLPSATGWQLIVNKEVGQWGLTYHPEFDLGRVPMTITSTKTPVEKFLIDLPKGKLRLQWDTTVAEVPVTVKQ